MTLRSILSTGLIISAFCWVFSQCPINLDMYTADPAARVFGDTLYVFTSHDKDDAQWFNMSDWQLFSTTDMHHWTSHGTVYSADSLNWASRLAWAPDAVYVRGKYYLYFPIEKNFIGVAVSDRPMGPFRDALDGPLISRQSPGVSAPRGLIDPAVFLDDDGSAYLVFGQIKVNIVKLNEDMVSFRDTIRIIKGAKGFFEAAWMHKYQGKYYLTYSGKSKLALRAKIRYAISDSPYGPFEYQGVILGKMNSGTNHASVVEYKNQWYLFYHNADLFFQKNPRAGKHTRDKWYKRSVCESALYYNEDGSIQRVRP